MFPYYAHLFNSFPHHLSCLFFYFYLIFFYHLPYCPNQFILLNIINFFYFSALNSFPPSKCLFSCLFSLSFPFIIASSFFFLLHLNFTFLIITFVYILTDNVICLRLQASCNCILLLLNNHHSPFYFHPPRIFFYHYFVFIYLFYFSLSNIYILNFSYRISLVNSFSSALFLLLFLSPCLFLYFVYLLFYSGSIPESTNVKYQVCCNVRKWLSKCICFYLLTLSEGTFLRMIPNNTDSPVLKKVPSG